MNVGMIFGIIFALILIGFLMVYGIKTITQLFGFAGEASFEKNVRDFQTAVNDVYQLSMGSTQKFHFRITSDIERICFINRADKSIWGDDPIMSELVSEGNNLIVSGKKIKAYKINHMLPSTNFCIEEAGDVLLVNKGRWVDVRMME